MREFRRAGIANLGMLTSEIGLKLSSPVRWPRSNSPLRAAVEAARLGIASRSLDFGSMAQVLVTATEHHVRAARLSRRKMKSSDARLSRALSSYFNREARLLWETFGECVPAKAAYDGSAFRVNLVFDLVSGGLLYEGIDEVGLKAYGWTSRGHDLLMFPPPIGPSESRLIREDFDDLFAAG